MKHFHSRIYIKSLKRAENRQDRCVIKVEFEEEENSRFVFLLSGKKITDRFRCRFFFGSMVGMKEKNDIRKKKRGKVLSVSSFLFFSYNSMTIVHKVNRHIFFYSVNRKEEKRTVNPWKAAYRI